MEWLIALAVYFLARPTAYVPPPRKESAWRNAPDWLRQDWSDQGLNAKDVQVGWGGGRRAGGPMVDNDRSRESPDERGRPPRPGAGGGRPGEWMP